MDYKSLYINLYDLQCKIIRQDKRSNEEVKLWMKLADATEIIWWDLLTQDEKDEINSGES